MGRPERTAGQPAAGQPETVIVYKAVIRGPNQRKLYLKTHLPALLAGRLAVARKNMRLDWAVEGVVDNCLKCYRNDPGKRLGLALEIADQSPYPEAKMKALELLGEQITHSPRPTPEQNPFWQDVMGRLITIADTADAAELRSAAFAITAQVGGDLRGDCFPLLFPSLAGETDQKCFIAKFLALSRYLEVMTRPINSPRVPEERLNQFLGQMQKRLDAVGPLEAVKFIFSVLWQHDYGCYQGIIFERPPLDLATLQKICREAPPEQQAEVIDKVRRGLKELIDDHSYIGSGVVKNGPHEARKALVGFAFPDIKQTQI